MEIELTQGKVAIIDDDDWPLVSQYKWYAAKSSGNNWYARAARPGAKVNEPKLLMHNVIFGDKKIDHIDGNGLNNRRSNLRKCDDAQNQQNTSSRKGSSQYKGVSWCSRKKRWRVAFNWRSKTYFVGYFRCEHEAAIAYNKAVVPLAGEFARQNSVQNGTESIENQQIKR